MNALNTLSPHFRIVETFNKMRLIESSVGGKNEEGVLGYYVIRCALKLKGKFHPTTIRPMLLYGSE